MFWASKSGAKSSMTEEQAVVVRIIKNILDHTIHGCPVLAKQVQLETYLERQGKQYLARRCGNLVQKSRHFCSHDLSFMLLHKHQGVRAMFRHVRLFSNDQDRYPGDLQRDGLLVDEAVSVSKLGRCAQQQQQKCFHGAHFAHPVDA